MLAQMTVRALAVQSLYGQPTDPETLRLHIDAVRIGLGGCGVYDGASRSSPVPLKNQGEDET